MSIVTPDELLPKETFMQNLAALEDPQAARAKELESLGEHRRAQRVLACRNPESLHPKQTCKQRLCPGCAAHYAQQNAWKADAIISQMLRPVVTLFTMSSKAIYDLNETITRFRAALTKIRRRKVLSNVRSAVGAIETAQATEGNRWNVHVHLVVDALDGLDEAGINTAWRKLTNSRGTFGTNGPPRSTSALSVYLTKSETWCPPPGALTSKGLDVLRRGIHGRQLLVRWGAARSLGVRRG